MAVQYVESGPRTPQNHEFVGSYSTLWWAFLFPKLTHPEKTIVESEKILIQ